MNNKEIPKHYHHFEGGMREDVDELLEKYKVFPVPAKRRMLFIHL